MSSRIKPSDFNGIESIVDEVANSGGHCVKILSIHGMSVKSNFLLNSYFLYMRIQTKTGFHSFCPKFKIAG